MKELTIMPTAYSFSEKLSSLKPSAIREILKFTSGTDVIPFAAGNPAVEAFPVEEIAAITKNILTRNPATYLQYGISEGYTPLRDTMKQRLAQSGLVSEEDDLIIVSGAQQGIELSCKIFCDTGDQIITESPSFIGSLNAFRSYGIRLCGVPMDEDGIQIDLLEETLKVNDRVRLIYVIPNFQNPSGITMSLEKRKAVYQLACRYNKIIIEDNPYGDLRFAEEDIPSIKSMDTEGRVIYCGSFSKLLAPGMRVGYVLANKEIISKLTVAKQVSDVHSNLLAQITVHEFITQYDFEQHIQKLKSIYRKKCGLMTEGIRQHMPKEIHFTNPQGGLFILGTLPAGSDVAAFCKAAIAEKVAVVPGLAFLTDESQPCTTIRLNYSTPSDEQIIRGMEILGRVSYEFLGLK